MPVLDAIRRSLLGERTQVRTGRCRDCHADFSLDGGSADATCPYCGSPNVKLHE